MHATLLTVGILTLAVLSPPTVHAQGHHGSMPISSTPSPHDVASDTVIVGLTADEVAELRAGQGMGQSRVADAQGYPGPRHVLDAAGAGALVLSSAQAARVREIYQTMASKAQRLGGLVLDAEEDLAHAFRDGGVDTTNIQARVERIAVLRGELRAVHLRAHLETRALLDATQIARYMTLRGYTPDDGSPPTGH